LNFNEIERKAAELGYKKTAKFLEEDKLISNLLKEENL